MDEEKKVVVEAEETPIDLVKGSRDTFLKLLALAVVGLVMIVFGVKLFVEILIILGAIIFAGPLVICLCFGLPLIDIGPVFRAVDTPMGNFIQRTFVPDISGQMSANLALTLIRALFMLLLSVILMPILILLSFIGYKSARKKALRYAEEQGLPEQAVPRLSLIVTGGLLAFLVVGIISANLIESAVDKKQNEAYDEKMAAMTVVFDEFQEDMDDILLGEYYAEAYKGEGYTGGFVAQFKIGDKTVLCGKSKPLTEYPDALTSSSVYYIIDDLLYIDRYGTNTFEICQENEVKELLKARHANAHFGEGMTLEDAMTGVDYDNAVMEGAILYLEVAYEDGYYRLHFDSQNNLIGYGYSGYKAERVETQFVFKETSKMNSLKEAAQKLIDGTANVQ